MGFIAFCITVSLKENLGVLEQERDSEATTICTKMVDNHLIEHLLFLSWGVKPSGNFS
jgi:hypothetical protein